MAETWLVEHSGHQRGVTRTELQALAASGALRADALVFHPLEKRWRYAAELGELGPWSLGEASVRGEAAGELAAVPGACNDAAIAGFTLGVLGIVPVFGIACALVGLPLALRGMHRAAALGGTDRRFAVAGLVLSLASLVLNGGATLIAILN